MPASPTWSPLDTMAIRSNILDRMAKAPLRTFKFRKYLGQPSAEQLAMALTPPKETIADYVRYQVPVEDALDLKCDAAAGVDLDQNCSRYPMGRRHLVESLPDGADWIRMNNRFFDPLDTSLPKFQAATASTAGAQSSITLADIQRAMDQIKNMSPTPPKEIELTQGEYDEFMSVLGELAPEMLLEQRNANQFGGVLIVVRPDALVRAKRAARAMGLDVDRPMPIGSIKFEETKAERQSFRFTTYPFHLGPT